jgi:hypothetical protein
MNTPDHLIGINEAEADVLLPRRMLPGYDVIIHLSFQITLNHTSYSYIQDVMIHQTHCKFDEIKRGTVNYLILGEGVLGHGTWNGCPLP